MIEKFTFDIEAPAYGLLSRLEHENQKFTATKTMKRKMVLVKNDCELRTHIVLKLLAFVLYYDPRLQIEMDLGMHYKPDLSIPGDHGIPEMWIDCGQVAPKKVESLSTKLKNTRLCVVKENQRDMDVFRKLIEKKLDRPERVEYLAFDKGFAAGMADSLQRSNEITLYQVMENVIGVVLNQQVFESALYR